MSVERILSIGFGTQSLKAIVFDLEGNLLARRQVVFRPYVSLQLG
jgi:sugar (pentulose or hexulose) kinase